MSRFLALILRGGSVFGKSLLVILLAKYLEPSQLGLYGLVIATVYYSVFLLGFDFYTYSTRELIRCHGENLGFVIKSGFFVYFLTYAIFLPIIFLAFYFDFLPFGIVFYFFCILLFEHLSQEVVRLLNALKQPVYSALVLFIRNGAWAYVAAVVVFFYESQRSIEFLMVCWLVGVFFSTVVGFFLVLKFNLIDWSEKIDFFWIFKGLKVGFYFLLATLSIRGVLTFDRYLIEQINGLDFLGVYVFYFSVASIMLMVVDAVISVFYYPDVISSYNDKDYLRYFSVLKKYKREVVGFVVLFSVVSVPLLYFLLEPLGLGYYKDFYNVYLMLLLALSFFAVSNVFHYMLYAMSLDRLIICIHVFSIIIFMFASVMFWLAGFEYAVLYSIISTMIFVFSAKMVAGELMNKKIIF